MRIQFCWFVPWLAALLAAGCAKDRDEVETRPELHRGLQVYQVYCQECHDTGKGGAPELEDTDEWDERSFEWKAIMTNHARHGFLGMPARGSHPQMSERDLRDALYFMDIKIQSEDE